MLIPPNEHVLLLAERWLKLLSDLGRAQATLSAYRSALRHYFAFCSQRSIEPEKARFEDLAAYISPQLPGMPFQRPAPRSSFACLQSASGMTFLCIWTSARSIRCPDPARPAC